MLTADRSLPTWSLLFAREPDPDLELDEVFDELDSEQSSGRGNWSPKESKEPSGRRTMLWLLLFVVLAAGAYLMASSEALLEMLGLEQSEVMTPDVPAPTAEALNPAAASPNPAPQPATVAAAPEPALASPPTPVPSFREGQKVQIVANEIAPPSVVTLAGDVEGAKPGPTIPPGATLTVLDGELRNNVWIYLVRSDEGTTGWIPESQLKPKL